MEGRERRRHDELFNLFFSQKLAVADLHYGFLASPEWLRERPLVRADPMPTEHVTCRLARRRSDLAWRMRFEGMAETVVLLLEHQSRPLRWMAYRTTQYTMDTYEALIRRKLLDPGGKLPIVRSVVVYSGVRRWTSALDMADLIGLPSREMAEDVIRKRYRLIDMMAPPTTDSTKWNSVAALMRLLQAYGSSMADASRVLDEVAIRLAGSEHLEMRRAFQAWAEEGVRQWGVTEEYFRQIRSLEERKVFFENVKLAKERLVQDSIAQGIVQGRAEGNRALVGRLVEVKFGARAAKRLSGHLDGLGPERVTEVAEAVAQCGTADEVFARLKLS